MEKDNKNFKTIAIVVICLLIIILGLLLGYKLLFKNEKKNETKQIICTMDTPKKDKMSKGDFLQYVMKSKGEWSSLIDSYLEDKGGEEATKLYQQGKYDILFSKYDKDYSMSKYYFYEYEVFDNKDLENLCEPVTYEFVIRAIVQNIYHIARDINKDVSNITLSNEKNYKYTNDIKIYMKSVNIAEEDFSKTLTNDEVAKLVENAIYLDNNSHYEDQGFTSVYNDD